MKMMDDENNVKMPEQTGGLVLYLHVKKIFWMFDVLYFSTEFDY